MLGELLQSVPQNLSWPSRLALPTRDALESDLELRPWTVSPPEAEPGATSRATSSAIKPAIEPSRPITAPTLGRNSVSSPRASPRAMRMTWRAERGIMRKPALPGGQETGTERLAARLSVMSTQKLQASALAAKRGMDMELMLGENSALRLQIDVMRAAHEQLAATVATLEQRLRSECQDGGKLKSQLERARARAEQATEKEALAREEMTIMQIKLAEQRAEYTARDRTATAMKQQVAKLSQERDAAYVQASTRTAERDSAAAAYAESRTELAQLEEQKQLVQQQLEHARQQLLDEREARQQREVEHLRAVEAEEEAVQKADTANMQLEQERQLAADMMRLGKEVEELLAGFDMEGGRGSLTDRLRAKLQGLELAGIC